MPKKTSRNENCLMSTENNRLKLLRKKHGYKQDEIADMLGVKNSAVSKWECGRTMPDAEALVFLADLYGVSVDHILGRTEEDDRLFDDARVPKSEVQEIFDKLNAVDKGKALGYMQSLIDMQEESRKR